MLNPKPKVLSLKDTSFYNKNARDKDLCKTEEAQIRLGIELADEEAKDGLRKRKIEAPLSIEEKALSDK